MTLLRLLKHWKSFSWYCVFQFGTCYLLYADKRFIEWIYSRGLIYEYRNARNLFQAYKYFKTYNRKELQK